MDLPKIMLLLKNPQFLSNQADIQAMSWSFSPSLIMIGFKSWIFY